jgi:hypothetical protein
MATTYEKIATTTLGAASATITLSSIPATYTDLRLVFVGGGASGGQFRLRLNSDTGTNYSSTIITGNGSSASSTRYTSVDGIKSGYDIGTTTFSLISFDIFSYAGSTNKTVLLQYSNDQNGSGQTQATVGLWRNTAAITSITLDLIGGIDFRANSSLTIYGIKAA